jgi:hypothetical protein
MSTEKRDDLTPELAAVREALSVHTFEDRVRELDELFALALKATEGDRKRWEQVATAHGASVTNPRDIPIDWTPDQLEHLTDLERLAWLAETVRELAVSYYGWGTSGLKTVAGNDLHSPGGLVRSLLYLSGGAAKATDEQQSDEPPAGST